MLRSRLSAILLGSVAAAAMATTPASALTITLTDIGGVTGTQADIGFRIAAKYWESVLTNAGTVQLNVGYSDLGPGVLGGTGSSLAPFVPIDTL